MKKKGMIILMIGAFLVLVIIIFFIYVKWFSIPTIELEESYKITEVESVNPSENELSDDNITQEEMEKIKKADQENTFQVSGSDEVSQNQSPQTAYEEYEVICSVETEEEAKKIAEQISGTLVKYEYGIGTIEITETVAQLMERLDHMSGDRPEVYPNYIYSLDQENN